MWILRNQEAEMRGDSAEQRSELRGRESLEILASADRRRWRVPERRGPARLLGRPLSGTITVDFIGLFYRNEISDFGMYEDANEQRLPFCARYTV